MSIVLKIAEAKGRATDTEYLLMGMRAIGRRVFKSALPATLATLQVSGAAAKY